MYRFTAALLAASAALPFVAAENATNATFDPTTYDGTGNYTHDADWDFNNTFGRWQSPSQPGPNAVNATASTERVLTLGKTTGNCDGSAGCSSWNPFKWHQPTRDDCTNAAGRFHPEIYYTKQACTKNHCAAMFECDNIRWYPPLYIEGWRVQDMFDLIINESEGMGCKNCGSVYFDNPYNASQKLRCHVTFNYCNWVCAEGEQKCGPYRDNGNGLPDSLPASKVGANGIPLANGVPLATIAVS